MCSLGMLGINPSHGLMTEARLTLHGVSYTLPNGRPLFSNLCCNFGSQRTALVGRNGVGKPYWPAFWLASCLPAAAA